MTTIRLFEHPLAAVAPQVFEVDSLALWLLRHFGDVPTVKVQVFAGQPSAETEITDNVPALIAGDAPEYTVLQSPGGFDPLSWYAIALYIAVGTVVAVSLMPKPEMPNSAVNRSQQSPNNALGARENKVRMLERVEDIYGTVKSIPSLMMPTYNIYINHQQYEVGYYCVGRGYCDVASLKDGDTLLADIAGASAEVYHPFTSPNSGTPVVTIGDAIPDGIITASRSIEVDGITLKAANQVNPPGSLSYTFGKVGSYNRIIQAGGAKPNFNGLGWAPGDSLTVANAAVATWANGTWTIQAIGDGWVDLTATAWTTTPTVDTADVYSPDHDYVPAWVTLPDLDRTEVWFNITAPQGIWQDIGGGKIQHAVLFMWVVETLNPTTLVPTGTMYSGFAQLDGATSDQRAMTLKIVGATGPLRARLFRFGDYDYTFGGSMSDEIKWTDLYSISPVTKTHFGNKTTIQTITRATARATAVKTRQLNCLASRLLPTYNGSGWSATLDATGLKTSGTLNATSKLVDILAAVTQDPKIGNRALTDLDMAQVWAVQQALDAWSAQAGQFNYTFDTDNTSFEETLIMISNTGFCIAYRQNGKIRLAFDKAQTASTALFTHRNKKPRSETITRKFASDSDYDGVEFVYMDPDSEQSETIRLPLDGSATKYKKFEIAGIRSFTQAWYRASREYAKLLGQRITLETTTTLDGRSLLPNSRIDVVDNTRFKSFDGEVVGQSGLTLTLSQDVAFTPATAHSIILMKRDGSLQSIACTAGLAANQVILGTAPAESIVTTYGQAGIRTIFSFAADSARAAQAWLVQEVDLTDGQYCTVRAINYSADYYAGDTAAVPAKASIIN